MTMQIKSGLKYTPKGPIFISKNQLKEKEKKYVDKTKKKIKTIVIVGVSILIGITIGLLI